MSVNETTVCPICQGETFVFTQPRDGLGLPITEPCPHCWASDPKPGRPRDPHPTASSIQRLALCPGSWRMALKHPEPRHKDNQDQEDADRGTDGHEALRWDDDTGLDMDMRETVGRARTLRRMLIEEHLGAEPDLHSYRERRFSLREGLDRVLSGQVDDLVVCRSTRRALIIDYKLLWGDHEPAPNNLQLATLAVLVDHELEGELDRIYTAIIQPRRGTGWSLCFYEREALDRAREYVEHILRRAHAAEAPLVAGQRQCRFCPAKLACPEAREQVEIVSRTALYREQVTDDELLRLFERCAPAKQMVGQIEAEVRRRLADPETAPDSPLLRALEIGDGVTRTEIPDARALYQELVRVCGPEKANDIFSRSVFVRWGQLKQNYRMAHQLGVFKSSGQPKYITHKLAEKDLRQMTEDNRLEKQTQGEIRLRKEALEA